MILVAFLSNQNPDILYGFTAVSNPDRILEKHK